MMKHSTEGRGIIRKVPPDVDPPTAGTDAVWTVDVNERWELLGIRFLFTADANAADRQVELRVYDLATASRLSFISLEVQIANEAFNYTFARGVTTTALDGAIQLVVQTAIGDDLVLFEAETIKTSIKNIQAGDAITSAGIIVESWMEDL